MIKDIALALWFFLPAGFANMAPVLAAKLPFVKGWDAPIDGGAAFRGSQLLGPHKTWRGLAAGVVLGTLVLWLQQVLARHAPGWTGWLTDGVDYHALPTLVLGPLFGIGALGGDAVESFFKRRHGTPPGHAWFPFDQTDYIIGSIIATLPVVRLGPLVCFYALALWPVIQLGAVYIGFRLNLRERPI